MSLDFTHAIIGAGVVGLSISAKLAKAGFSVLLIDKNPQIGLETSSRNSEVIHSGLYYPPQSLKSRLCIKGNKMLYEYMTAKKLENEFRKCGKWVVAQTENEKTYLNNLKTKGDSLGIPLSFIPLDEAKKLEPCVKAGAAILNSPSTGIINSHAFMQSLEADFVNHEGSLIVNTELNTVSKAPEGYKLSCNSSGEDVDLQVGTVINSGGLYAPKISHMIGCGYPAYQAKGNYFSYSGSQPKVNRLIYPCPSDFGSSGTHLTIDLQGNMRFGPDFEWVDSPTDYKVNTQRLKEAAKASKRYIDIDESKLIGDYCGLRPKVSKDMSKFHDFVISMDKPGFVNLIGIESPGLTSSLAIAEYVYKMINQ